MGLILWGPSSSSLAKKSGIWNTFGLHNSAKNRMGKSYTQLLCRFAVWPKVKNFLEMLPGGACLADVGCGNGKYFTVRKDLMIVGVDRSRGLCSHKASISLVDCYRLSTTCKDAS